MSETSAGRSIFVTVGTTLFDPLIDVVSSSGFLRSISKPQNGSYTEITIQYGKGRRPLVALDGEGADLVDDRGGGPAGGGSAAAADEIDRAVEVPTGGEAGGDVGAVRLRGYRFRPSLEPDMRSADLILSHAGAGSIMEGLALCADRPGEKKLAVVINSRLMHNHQHELAGAMEERGYLFVVPDPDLLLDEAMLARIEAFVPLPFPGGDDREFADLLDEHMGFSAENGAEKRKRL